MLNTLIAASGVLLVLVVSTSGSFMPKNYLEPWDKNYSARFDDPRIKVVSQAILAPSGHNMQPWKIKLDNNDKNVFYLYGDPGRLTPEIDPPARQFTITQGTFLEYLRVSAENLGYKANIILFPDDEYNAEGTKNSINQKTVAKIILQKDLPTNDPLYASLFLPDTNREAYQPDQLNQQQVESLLAQNQGKDIIIKIFQDQENIEKIKQLALQAMDIETKMHNINELNKTLTRVNEYQKNNSRYGFSLDSQGSSGIMLHLTQSLLTIVPSLNSEQAGKDLIMKNTKNQLDNTPAYILILTKNNSRLNQVKAGMLYSRLVLAAHTMGLAMQPLSQCLEEYAQMREIYQQTYKEFAPGGETIQMLARIGKPTKEAPRSMRRDAKDLINNPN